MISGLIGALRRRLEMRRYDDFTIAAYFRAQGAIVGEDCRILIRDLGPEPYLIRIGRHCTISTNVTFVTHDGGTWVFTEEHPSLQHFGPIHILDNCFIGTGATLMPGITVGPNAIVGAGAVVTRNVPANSVFAGVPAKHVSDLETYRLKCLRSWEAQRPHGYLVHLDDGTIHPPTAIHAAKLAQASLLRNHLERLFSQKRPERRFIHPCPRQ